MCSSQPPENGADSDPALWVHEQETLPEVKPAWIGRAQYGGWDKPQEEVSE
jgi:hypothetical protein